MSDKQSLRELEIFSLFTEVCSLAIQPGSIEKRNPPEPDIRCNISGEGLVAFEMVESIDPGFARQVADIELQTQLTDAFQNLSPAVRSELESRLGNAWVTVLFHLQTSKQKRKDAIPRILKSLQQVSPSFMGIQLPEDGLSQVVEGLIVVRGNSSGDLTSINLQADGLVIQRLTLSSKNLARSTPLPPRSSSWSTTRCRLCFLTGFGPSFVPFLNNV